MKCEHCKKSWVDNMDSLVKYTLHNIMYHGENENV
jgi:hypothetical protein